jgi:glycerophosphoryl diester phosphodiesterase
MAAKRAGVLLSSPGVRPWIIAHRGASGAAPENTAAAFLAALEQGADMVEFDVRWSADGVPVVLHDPTLDRTTDGRGEVAALPAATLRTLDAGSWFAPRFRGERVLTLAEALAILGARLRLNIELCGDTPPPTGFAARLLRLVEEARLPEPPLFSSFDFALLQALRAERPGARVAPLFRTTGEGTLRRALALRPDAVHPRRHLVTPALMRRLRAAGTRVHAWTVNEAAEARRLLRLGVDGIFTDHPARMVRLRDQEARRPGALAARRLSARRSSALEERRAGRPGGFRTRRGR